MSLEGIAACSLFCNIWKNSIKKGRSVRPFWFAEDLFWGSDLAAFFSGFSCFFYFISRFCCCFFNSLFCLFAVSSTLSAVLLQLSLQSFSQYQLSLPR